MSASPSRRRWLNLDTIEPTQKGTSDSEQEDVEQESNESVCEGI